MPSGLVVINLNVFKNMLLIYGEKRVFTASLLERTVHLADCKQPLLAPFPSTTATKLTKYCLYASNDD
jgi:hypothetical protein